LTLKAGAPRLAACAHWLVVPPIFVYRPLPSWLRLRRHLTIRREAIRLDAVHTAASFLSSELGLRWRPIRRTFARIAISDTVGGIVSRRLLPTVPIMIFVLGWVRGGRQKLGLYDTQFGSALMVLLSMTFVSSRLRGPQLPFITSM